MDREIFYQNVNLQDSTLTKKQQVKIYDLTGEHYEALIYMAK